MLSSIRKDNLGTTSNLINNNMFMTLLHTQKDTISKIGGDDGSGHFFLILNGGNYQQLTTTHSASFVFLENVIFLAGHLNIDTYPPLV